MSLYSRKKRNEQFDLEKSFGAYSGMFANLCKVFLLLYVVVTLQNITLTVSAQVRNQQLATAHKEDMQKVIDSYEKRLQAYEVHPAQRESETYKEAIRKLASLEDEKKTELDEKAKELRESQEKLDEVTSYKKLIKSIIDSKYVAQAKLEEVEKSKTESERALEALRKNYKNELEQKLEAEREKLENEFERKAKENAAETALEKKKLAQEKRKLSQEQVVAINAKLKELAKERRELRKGLADKFAEKQVALAEEYAEYKKETRDKYKGRYEKAKGQYESSITGFKDKLAKTQGALGDLEDENEGLKNANEGLKGDVDALRALKTGRGKLIGEIAAGLGAAFGQGGVNAETNNESGEVAILFRDTYFDYGSAKLKPEMKKVLAKALPIYANTVFGSRKYANKIGWVELVGFASPTFRGKYVDPANMSAEARRALNFNMDLSYRRAKSIFEFIFDPGEMKFPFQSSMVLMTKVAGRSYLATHAKKTARNPASADSVQKAFCQEHDCAAEQRVAIRFHLAEAVPKQDPKMEKKK